METVWFRAPMRFFPALAIALLPLVSVAQTDEWVRDDMTDESLWLLRTGNLSREPSTAGVFPGAPERSSQWVVSKGDGPAYVVYFLPGPIHEVEIDTHRLAGAAGDFTLAVSTDGKLYQPINAGSVLLDSSFGWDYRLMASDQIPENATHLLVQFPNGSSAHRLSEVWIRYTWDEALVNKFLPAPAVTPPARSEFSLQSDADLQLLLDQLMALPRKDPAPSIDPLDTYAEPATPSIPEPQSTFATTTPIEYSPALVQLETAAVVEDEEEEDEEIVGAAEPASVVGDTTQPETVETKESGEVDPAPDAPAVAEESAPAILADVPNAESNAFPESSSIVTEVAPDDQAVASVAAVTEESGLPTDAPVVAGKADEPEEPIELAAGLLHATATEVAPSGSGDTEIDVAEFTSAIDAVPALEAAVAIQEAGESIEIEPLAIAASEPRIAAGSETSPPTESAHAVETIEPDATELVATPAPRMPAEPVAEEPTPVAPEVTEIAVAEFEAPAAPATELIELASVTTTAESTPTFEHSRLPLADADDPKVPVNEPVNPEPIPPEPAPATAGIAETDPGVVVDVAAIAQAETPPPIPAIEPVVAIVEPPPEEPPQVEAIDPSVFVGPQVEVEVAANSPEVVAEPPAADATPEEPEQVWRLPPFDLPVMSASRAREERAAIAESVPPQPEAPAEELAGAPGATVTIEAPQTDLATSEPEFTAPEAPPAAQLDSGPMLIAAAEVPAIGAPEEFIPGDDEPLRKPAIKVRRIGPRSKSRDFYSARG